MNKEEKESRTKIRLLGVLLLLLVVLGALVGFQTGFKQGVDKVTVSKQSYMDNYCICPEKEPKFIIDAVPIWKSW